MSLASTRSSARRTSPNRSSFTYTRRTAAQDPSSSSSQDPAPPSSALPLLSPTTDPFNHLSPSLQPATLHSVPSRSTSPNDRSATRLDDFAQHVLMSNPPASSHPDDAASLLAFSGAGDHGDLFAGGRFGELLETAVEDDRQRRAEEEMLQIGQAPQHGDAGAAEAQQEGEGARGSTGGVGPIGVIGRGGRAGRKRRREDGEGENGDHLDPIKMKKDSHKEVERRRRENINDGIEQIARLIPGASDKLGKSALLRMAADHLSEITRRVETVDEEVAKRDAEKQALETELSNLHIRLADEQVRSIRYETSWREAEDRAASSQFELERVKAELQELRDKGR